jgi:hypothetical protein
MTQPQSSPAPAEYYELDTALDKEIQHWSEWFGIDFSAKAGSGLVWVLAKLVKPRLEAARSEGQLKGFADGYAARVAEEQQGYKPYEK